MEDNPYKSPLVQEGSKIERTSERRSYPWLILPAIIWAVLLILLLPSMTMRLHGPVPPFVGLKVMTTLVTLAVLFGLIFSASGWRHLLRLPLWLLVMLLQYGVWTWPGVP